MPLPTVDFLGLGAQRTASTWLDRCLRQHPQLYLPEVHKEIHYFNRLAGRAPPSMRVTSVLGGVLGTDEAAREWRTKVFWSLARIRSRHGLSIAGARALVRAVSFHAPGRKDDDWYRRQFTHGVGRVKGEITPAYALLDDSVVRHATSLFPDVKLIFILRDPVSRSLSQLRLRWAESRRHHRAPPADLAAFLTSRSVIDRNDYLRTIDTWGRYVPPERFLIGWYDDTLADPEGVMRRVTAFLGVDPEDRHVLAAARSRARIQAAGDLHVPPEVVRELAVAVRPGIAALAERLGGHAIRWLERCDRLVAGEHDDG